MSGSQRKGKNSAGYTSMMPGAEYHTDHGLVRCKLKPHFKTKPTKKSIVPDTPIIGQVNPNQKDTVQSDTFSHIEVMFSCSREGLV
ncbi:Hypothetical predicted protein [Octopus vulgaris]|uniref:Uncharacterized protein n=1 Tax=Octopus vulgaris TaxID=6645 RepID=A0AA36BA00_OCTVU|nr:Hypothetical predicted protein [Octopus vulgaris]